MNLSLPDDPYSEELQFLIDEEIEILRRATGRSKKLADRWCTSSDLIQIGRRALDMAVLHAEMAEERLQEAKWIKEWEEVQKATNRAAASLDELLKILANGSRNMRQSGARALEDSLLQMAIHKNKDVNLEHNKEWAKRSAILLIDAGQLISEMEIFSRDRRNSIAQGRSNPGEPGKTAFVQVMAETWFYLTGSFPGSSPVRNPFLRFVESAWQDAKGARDQSFAQPLNKALIYLRANQNEQNKFYSPSWIV